MRTRSSRLRTGHYWTLNLLALVALALVLLNIFLYVENRASQIEVNNRQQFINESIQLSRFNVQFVRALANVAAGTDDRQIRDLLAEHGITYTVNPSQGIPAPKNSE